MSADAREELPTEPPIALIEALRLALGDINTSHSVVALWLSRPDDWDDPEEPDTQRWWVDYRRWGPGEGGFIVGVTAGGACETFVDVADRLWDHLGDDRDSAAWPPYCGVHDHPAIPQCIGGEPRWCCPRGHSIWSAPIGTLGTPPQLTLEPDGPRMQLVVRWPSD